MKHFSDDGCNKQPTYDQSLLAHRADEHLDCNCRSERSIGCHYEPDLEDWYERTKHFQD